MAGNRSKKVEQPKTADQATALYRRAAQQQRENPKPIRAEFVPEGQTAKRTMPSGKGQTQNGGTRGSVTYGRISAGGTKSNGTTNGGGTSGTIQNGKATSSKARIERVFASESEAAKRGASGQPLRTKEEKGKYVSGADYKAWKTAQDKARQAKKGK